MRPNTTRQTGAAMATAAQSTAPKAAHRPRPARATATQADDEGDDVGAGLHGRTTDLEQPTATSMVRTGASGSVDPRHSALDVEALAVAVGRGDLAEADVGVHHDVALPGHAHLDVAEVEAVAERLVGGRRAAGQVDDVLADRQVGRTSAASRREPSGRHGGRRCRGRGPARRWCPRATRIVRQQEAGAPRTPHGRARGRPAARGRQHQQGGRRPCQRLDHDARRGCDRQAGPCRADADEDAEPRACAAAAHRGGRAGGGATRGPSAGVQAGRGGRVDVGDPVGGASGSRLSRRCCQAWAHARTGWWAAGGGGGGGRPGVPRPAGEAEAQDHPGQGEHDERAGSGAGDGRGHGRGDEDDDGHQRAPRPGPCGGEQPVQGATPPRSGRSAHRAA